MSEVEFDDKLHELCGQNNYVDRVKMAKGRFLIAASPATTENDLVAWQVAYILEEAREALVDRGQTTFTMPPKFSLHSHSRRMLKLLGITCSGHNDGYAIEINLDALKPPKKEPEKPLYPLKGDDYWTIVELDCGGTLMARRDPVRGLELVGIVKKTFTIDFKRWFGVHAHDYPRGALMTPGRRDEYIFLKD